MPELPDLVYIVKKLSECLPGQRIESIRIKEPIVLRVLISESMENALKGAVFQKVYRHGPFVCIDFDNQKRLVIHPMLAGKFKLAGSKKKPGRGHCFSLQLDNDISVNYLDDKKMGKVYLIHDGQQHMIPRFQQQGVDITTDEFTENAFETLLKSQRKQIRVFLMDQTKLSAIGNAYADEILFDAGIHPKTFCYQLTGKDIDQLYASIVRVIKWGIAEVDKAAQPIEIKVRDHVRVRNRKDQPCPQCGDKIRRAGVLGYDAFFCPSCQPPKRKQFIDWRQ